MNLIASYRNKGFESVADGVMSFSIVAQTYIAMESPSAMDQIMIQILQKFLLISAL